MTEPIDLTPALLALGRALRAEQGALLASHGLHPGQDALLMAVWDRPGSTQSQLAQRLGVEAPTVTRMVTRLERTGLLERQRDPDDARRLRIQPTARSRLIEVRVRKCWDEIAGVLTEELGDADAEMFSRLVTRATTALRRADRGHDD